ncbi:hypothetical protein [Candidatus Colwellia aromaticivorans]|uniref:hypothetical protein n=1 Tax=Candidatus Colwellia aromaticivorans TaxID=2267621 RepID=UPI000DF16006|nr:hypothetical protein [Candidatus Colwellia aromaticivorans]
MAGFPLSFDKVTPIIIVVALLSACGGGDDDSSTSGNPEKCTKTSIYYCPTSVFRDPFGIALTLAWYSGQCTEEVLCEEDANVPVIDPDQGVIDDDFVAANWTTTLITQTEPNDIFEQATPFILRPQSGVSTTGSVDNSSDPIDYLAFIIDGEPTITIYLCATPTDCQQPWYAGSDLYMELYNENQVLLESTDVPSFHGHAFTGPILYDGQQYFLSIRVRETSVGEFPYKVVITD